MISQLADTHMNEARDEGGFAAAQRGVILLPSTGYMTVRQPRWESRVTKWVLDVPLCLSD
jgi:hypothetical protein